MRSTALPAKSALITRLRDRLGASVLVQRGLPLEIPAQKERVYVVRTLDRRRTPLTQQGARTETYDVEIIIEVEKPGGTETVYLATENRVEELLGEIEAELAEDDELGDVVQSSDLSSVPESFVLPNEDNTGYIGRAVARVSVQAWV